jgi:acetyltransferase-like isoleucine patch superfamily enzyme
MLKSILYFVQFIITKARSRFLKFVYNYKIFKYSKYNNCHISQLSNLTGSFDRLKIGSGTVINSYANFRFKNGNIKIGKDCLFGQNVTIITNSYKINENQIISPDRMFSKDVIIGDYVWIGVNVVILPGVKIGDRAIVGSSAVVTKNIPSGEIWGGVPAKKIK